MDESRKRPAWLDRLESPFVLVSSSSFPAPAFAATERRSSARPPPRLGT